MPLDRVPGQSFDALVDHTDGRRERLNGFLLAPPPDVSRRADPIRIRNPSRVSRMGITPQRAIVDPAGVSGGDEDRDGVTTAF